MLSDKQFVWAFGLGNVGQMGGGNAESHSVPTRVASMDGKGAHLVSCGASQVRARAGVRDRDGARASLSLTLTLTLTPHPRPLR